jgi:hypothetical protein
MSCGKRGELIPRYGMAHQGHPREPQGVEYGFEIGDPRRQVIARPWLARGSVPPAGDREDVIAIGELRREVVEAVRHVLET